MRTVLQRVTQGQVSVNGSVVAHIQKGLVVLLGIGPQDGEADANELAEKLVNLRIFEDAEEKMNLSLMDVNGEVIVISQFTLYADTRHGRRPSFIQAAKPEQAKYLVDYFVECLKSMGVPTQTGVFGEHMVVDIQNDGPVTIVLEHPSK